MVVLYYLIAAVGFGKAASVGDLVECSSQNSNFFSIILQTSYNCLIFKPQLVNGLIMLAFGLLLL